MCAMMIYLLLSAFTYGQLVVGGDFNYYSKGYQDISNLSKYQMNSRFPLLVAVVCVAWCSV